MAWLESRSSEKTNASVSLWGQALLSVLQLAPTSALPRHVAFIMDGNRRFARSNNLDNCLQGHHQGFTKMTQVLAWCRDLCIPEVSVYAFSIENFRRSQAEVDGLLDLARAKFKELLDQEDKLRESAVVVRICGELHMLPEDLQQLAQRIEAITKENEPKRKLNICLAYTSRAEIVHAMKACLDEEGEEILSKSVEEVEQCIENRLYISSKVDLLIRTSGETRLSDFMLWQCCEDTVIHFTPVLWPDFSVWDLFLAILNYHRHKLALKTFQTSHPFETEQCNGHHNNNYQTSNGATL